MCAAEAWVAWRGWVGWFGPLGLRPSGAVEREGPAARRTGTRLLTRCSVEVWAFR